jgi:hypothetical protein
MILYRAAFAAAISLGRVAVVAGDPSIVADAMRIGASPVQTFPYA